MVLSTEATRRRELLDPLNQHVNDSDLHSLASKFSETYKHLAKSSTEHFLATPVTGLPSGSEKGKFVALDVGGTNLRVGIIELLGDHSPKLRRSHDKAWPIEDHMKMDKAEDLFAWIGDCIAEVITAAIDESGPDTFENIIPLGITFSFPMTQSSMSEAILMPMGKGFAITSDLNLGRMLLAGYARHCETEAPIIANGDPPNSPSVRPTKKRKVHQLPSLSIAAITNDTVATFAASSYLVKAAPRSQTAMGLIVGTGCNATIPMKLETLHETKQTSIVLPEDASPESTTIVINTEWTIRGTDVPMKEIGIPTKWDEILDKNSEYPGFQPFEYMTAGRYLGEIVRLAFVDLIARETPDIVLPEPLLEKNAISTMFLATAVALEDNKALQAKLEELFPSVGESGFNWDVTSIELLRDIAEGVQNRASALIAAACVGLLACVGEITLDDSPISSQNGDARTNPTSADMDELVIAYTGKTIAGYPKFLESCQSWIDRLVKRGSRQNVSKSVKLKPIVDGGILGAAVLAGMATHKG